MLAFWQKVAKKESTKLLLNVNMLQICNIQT